MSYSNITQNNGVDYAETQMNEIVKKNKRLKMVIIALVCAVVLVLAAVVCVLFMDSDDEQMQNPDGKKPGEIVIGAEITDNHGCHSERTKCVEESCDFVQL